MYCELNIFILKYIYLERYLEKDIPFDKIELNTIYRVYH